MILSQVLYSHFFLVGEITKAMGHCPTLLFFRKYVRYIYQVKAGARPFSDGDFKTFPIRVEYSCVCSKDSLRPPLFVKKSTKENIETHVLCLD